MRATRKEYDKQKFEKKSTIASNGEGRLLFVVINFWQYLEPKIYYVIQEGDKEQIIHDFDMALAFFNGEV